MRLHEANVLEVSKRVQYVRGEIRHARVACHLGRSAVDLIEATEWRGE
jgi:hypothetical protein